MKKILATLWAVIIIGIIFISIKLFKPDAVTEIGTPEKITEVQPVITETEIIDSKNLPANYSEALVKADQAFSEEDYATAIKNYSYAATLNTKSSGLLSKLAESYLKNNQPKEAKEIFGKASELDPNSTKIKLGLARAYLDLRDAENAKNIVWALPANDPEVKYYTSLILILYKDFEGAKIRFQEIADSTEISDQELIAKAKNFLEAYATYSYFPESPLIHLETLLAKAFTANKHFEPAIPLLFDVINQKNNYRDAWIILGYSYLNVGKYNDAVDALIKAKDMSPEKPETLFFLGLAYFANNEIDNAIYYLKEADRTGFEPKEQIDLKLGDLYLLKEEYKEASAQYEKVLSANTTNLDVFVKAVWLSIEKTAEPLKALQLAKTALEEHPNEAMSLNLVGWALAANDEKEEAKNYLSKSLLMDPEFDAAYLNFGWLYEKTGELNLAKEYYKKAYFLGQENSVANLAAIRFNKLSEEEKNRFFKADVTSPTLQSEAKQSIK